MKPLLPFATSAASAVFSLVVATSIASLGHAQVIARHAVDANGAP
ncbi:MAG: hypothetical protein ABL967_12185 [Bryobacteraceae bacterium]